MNDKIQNKDEEKKESKKEKIFKELNEYICISVGVFFVALSFSFFLDPYNLVIGGVSGAGVILETVNIDPTISILVINIILLIFAFIFLGRKMFLKTAFGALLYPVIIKPLNILYAYLVELNGGELLIKMEGNMLLITLFSALIMGLGLGIAVKHGGTTGGTEIPQNILYKFWKIPYSLSLFMIDGTVVLLGFFFVKDADGNFQYNFLLYEIIFIYLSGVVMDQIVFRGFNKRAVYIISDKNEIIKQRILSELERGVTEVDVIGGYTNEGKTKLMCVLSSSQFFKLKAIINEEDPKAFYFVTKASEVSGEGFTFDEVFMKTRKNKNGDKDGDNISE